MMKKILSLIVLVFILVSTFSCSEDTKYTKAFLVNVIYTNGDNEEFVIERLETDNKPAYIYFDPSEGCLCVSNSKAIGYKFYSVVCCDVRRFETIKEYRINK